MSFLQQEIAQQPDVIARLLAEEAHNARAIAAAIRDHNPPFVLIAARGTSDNAARYAQYLFGSLARLPVALATPSLHTLYHTPPDLSRALVIGISQSGMAADVAQVLTDARAQGALTVAITNNPASLLASAARHHIALHAGEEVSVAATKTYTAQLAAVALLVTALVDDAALRDDLLNVPSAVVQALQLSEPVATWAERYRYMAHFASIGRGYNYCTAFEISLKVKELCYVIGHPYSEADFLHGPIAIIQPGFPVIVTAPRGRTYAPLRDLLVRLRQRDAESLVISDDPAAFDLARQRMPIPPTLPEWLTPITAIVPAQAFALHLALAKGHEVDKPRGLNKVTVTL